MILSSGQEKWEMENGESVSFLQFLEQEKLTWEKPGHRVCQSSHSGL